MTAWIIAWLSKRLFGAIAIEGLKSFPWKWFGIGLVVIAVVTTIGFGALHYRDLQNKLIENAAEIATQQLKAGLEKARADAITTMHDTATRQMQDLEDARSKIEAEAAELRTTIQNLNLEDISHEDQAKADAAIDRLNARNLELNRLQNQQSRARQVRPGKAGSGQAGPTRAPGLVKRAIQALRPNGVSQP